MLIFFRVTSKIKVKDVVLMKKRTFALKFSLLFFLALLSSGLTAQENPPASGPKLFEAVNYAGGNLGLSTGTAGDEHHFFAEGLFQYNLKDWTFFAGAQATKESGSITISAQYWPFTWERSRLGAKLIYNLDIYGDISLTNNILPGITFECQPSSWFAFRIDTFYLFKGRFVYALEDQAFQPINTFAYRQELLFYLPYDITLSQYVATYSSFRYTQPADLELGLAASWDMDENWTFTADITSRQIIYYLFTTAFTAWEFRLGARYRI